MNITIMHLYYDLMNLYGENGNIKAIKSYLEQLGINVKIKFVTIDDEINLNNVDFIYIGSGTEENQKLVLNHLKKYKNEIKNYIDKNKFILATGNSFELFGKKLTLNKKNYECLGLFEYNTIAEDFRIVDEVIVKSKLINEPIIGFVNHYGIIKDIKTPLFEVIKGTGNYPKDKNEGFNYLNFYGTHIIGPILVRNPYLLTKIINNLIKQKDKNFKLKKGNLNFEIEAYQHYIKKYNN